MKYSAQFLIDDAIGRLCSTIHGLILRPGELAGSQPTPEDIARLREALQRAGSDWVESVGNSESACLVEAESDREGMSVVYQALTDGFNKRYEDAKKLAGGIGKGAEQIRDAEKLLVDIVE